MNSVSSTVSFWSCAWMTADSSTYWFQDELLRRTAVSVDNSIKLHKQWNSFFTKVFKFNTKLTSGPTSSRRSFQSGQQSFSLQDLASFSEEMLRTFGGKRIKNKLKKIIDNFFSGDQTPLRKSHSPWKLFWHALCTKKVLIKMKLNSKIFNLKKNK